MKLNLELLKEAKNLKNYQLPQYDPASVASYTKQHPQWMHFGAGNIFRIFPAVLCQRLLDQGDMETGVICCEGYDDEIITRCFRPHDNLSIAVTLHTDGKIEKEIVGSVSESLTAQHDSDRIREIFENLSLQMVSFTITEKGYAIRDMQNEIIPAAASDMKKGPEGCRHLMSQLAAFCIARYHACGTPLALVSMDNCSHNGEKLRSSVLEIAKAWLEHGKISADAYAYLSGKISFPWTMIDKITPRPDELVKQQLTADGFEDIAPFVTAKNTYTAAFVNAEKPQYLVMEDSFPNGRPQLEKAGVYMTDRDTVNRTERMKVTTCLNPLHTAMSVYGCMLGYTLISEEMKDPDIVNLIRMLGYQEGLPVVTDPGILSPKAFLDEVMEQRLPNPFMPDAPQRIATDTSQKVGIRFGETIKNYVAGNLDTGSLIALPLAIAGWLRYLLAVDDELRPMEVSADPMKDELQRKLAGIMVGKPETCQNQLREILSNAAVFGSDLTANGLADKIICMFREELEGAGAVRRTLQKYCSGSRQ